MAKTWTIKELKKACENEISKGNGDKIIMISKDDEGNGWHYLFYGFVDYDVDYDWNEDLDTRLSNKSNTVLLG